MLTKLLNDVHTTKDNSTFDQIKVLASFAFIVYHLLWIMDVYFTHAFEAKDYAEGIAMMFAAMGASIWAKKDTEPGN